MTFLRLVGQDVPDHQISWDHSAPNPTSSSPKPRNTAVRIDDAPPTTSHNAAARRHVARENAAASRLPDLDARKIMALRVVEMLEGGRAAILTPESREGLLRVGRVLGLRAFDASLVIAIVQDAARRGEPLNTSIVSDRLAMASSPTTQPPAPNHPASPHTAWPTVLAIALAMSLASLLLMFAALVLRAPVL